MFSFFFYFLVINKKKMNTYIQLYILCLASIISANNTTESIDNNKNISSILFLDNSKTHDTNLHNNNNRHNLQELINQLHSLTVENRNHHEENNANTSEVYNFETLFNILRDISVPFVSSTTTATDNTLEKHFATIIKNGPMIGSFVAFTGLLIGAVSCLLKNKYCRSCCLNDCQRDLHRATDAKFFNEV